MTSRKNLKSPKKPRSTSKKNKHPIKNSQKSKNRMKKKSQKKKRGGAELSEEEKRDLIIGFFQRLANLKEKINKFKGDVYPILHDLEAKTKQDILDTISLELNKEQERILFNDLDFNNQLSSTPVSTPTTLKRKRENIENIKITLSKYESQMTLMNKLVDYIQNREKELTTLVNEILAEIKKLTEIERLNSDSQNTYFTEENIRKYAKDFTAEIPDTIVVNTVISEKESSVPEGVDANNLGSQMDGESPGDIPKEENYLV